MKNLWLNLNGDIAFFANYNKCGSWNIRQYLVMIDKLIWWYGRNLNPTETYLVLSSYLVISISGDNLIGDIAFFPNFYVFPGAGNNNKLTKYFAFKRM